MEKNDFNNAKTKNLLKPEYSMYDFLEKSATNYEDMYTILGRYIPQLSGDFSTANLVNKLTEIADNMESPKIFLNEYPESFDKLASMLLISADNSIAVSNKSQSIKRELTKEEKDSLLAKFNELVSDDSLSSIKDYIEYAKSDTNNPDLKALRDLIVEYAVDVGNEHEMLTLRHKLLSYVYIPQVTNELKEKYPSVDRADGVYPEWNEIDFIQKTLSNEVKLDAYDKYLQKHKDRVKQFQMEDAIKLSCEEKRNQHVNKSIIATMSNDDAIQARRSGFENVFFDTTVRPPEEGSTSWKVSLFNEPEVLLDMLADYSKNGIENQRVIAISYGKFHYKNFITENSITQPDLVGITRIGKDGVNNYFSIIPLDTIKFSDSSLKDGERKYDIYINGVKTKVNATYSRKIPKDLVDFYTQTFLSDAYLKSVTEKNYRYAGFISRMPKGPIIQPTDTGSWDLDAARYASFYPGTVDYKTVGSKTVVSKTVPSLEEYCKSHELLEKQLRIVREISNKTYESKVDETTASTNNFDEEEQGESR